MWGAVWGGVHRWTVCHICVVYLLCVSACASWYFQPKWTVSHRCHICVASLQYVLICASWYFQPKWTVSHRCHICVASLKYVLICASWDFQLQWIVCHRCVIMFWFRLPTRVNCFSHMSHLCGFFPVCINMCWFRWPASVNCFSQMCCFYPVCTVLHISGCPIIRDAYNVARTTFILEMVILLMTVIILTIR